MRIRCDGCGEIQHDTTYEDETILHVHGYHKEGRYMWELRDDFGHLIAEGTDHICPDL